MATDVRIVLVTVPAEGGGRVGDEIAKSLVEARLAACVNHLPNMTSTYRWEGEVQVDSEELLVVKTTTDAVEALSRRIVELHPYDVPEVLVLTVESGLEEYLGWVRGSCGSD